MTELCGCLQGEGQHPALDSLLSSQLSPKRLECVTQGCCSRRQREGSGLEARSRTRRGCWPRFARRTLSFLAPPAAAHPAARSPARRVTVTPDGSSGLRIPAAPSQEEGKRFPAAGYPKPASLRPPCAGARSASCILPYGLPEHHCAGAAIRWSCSACQNDTQTQTFQGKRENPCLRLGFWRSTHLANLP